MPKFHPWRNSLIFSVVVWCFALGYAYLYRSTLNLAAYSEALAFTGGILFGCSFGLSIMSYFFDFLDTKLVYRKQIGLIGYFFALGHAISLLFRFPAVYIESFPNWLTNPEAILGLTAMAIFTMMALISNKTGTRLTGRYFRPLLRLGYLAYALLIVRAWLIMNTSWLKWWEVPTGVMPPRMALSIFASTVILLRVFMEIRLRMKRK